MKTEAEIIAKLIADARAWHEPGRTYCPFCEGNPNYPSENPCQIIELATTLEQTEARGEALAADNLDYAVGLSAMREQIAEMVAERDRLRAVVRAALDTPPMAGSPGSPWDRFNEAKAKLRPGDLGD